MADIQATDAKTGAAQSRVPEGQGASPKREIRTDLCIIGAGSGRALRRGDRSLLRCAGGAGRARRHGR